MDLEAEEALARLKSVAVDSLSLATVFIFPEDIFSELGFEEGIEGSLITAPDFIAFGLSTTAAGVVILLEAAIFDKLVLLSSR